MRSAWLGLLLLCAAWDPVTRKVREVEEGNRLYATGEFAEAEQRYREAQRRLPGEAGVHFDLGAALHRRAQALPPGPERDALLDQAETALRAALDASEAKLRSSAHYNLGNTLYERGKFGEAIAEYKKSLRLDPERDDARHNLELALRMLEQPPPQPQPQSSDQQQPDQPQDGRQQPPPQGGDEQKPDADQQQPQPDDAEEERQRQAQAPQPEPRDLSDADVERKLRELERRSKDLQVQRAAERSQERRRGKPVKDW